MWRADPGAIQAIPEENIEAAPSPGLRRMALLTQVELEERSLRLQQSQTLSRKTPSNGRVPRHRSTLIRI